MTISTRPWGAILLACLIGAACWAQTPTGAIEGIVSDPSGAVIPNAKVIVTEPSTGRTITLTTNAAGLYAARNLLPSIYAVRVESPGFATKEIREVKVDTGAVVNGNVMMEIGRTGDVVQVEAQAITVDTARQTVDTIIGEKEVKNLPLFSRNFMDLATIAPGVFSRDGEQIDPTKAGAYRVVSIAGRSGTATRVQIDGIDVTDETVGATTSNISDEAVNQFQVTRSSLDISTSLTSSGSVNVITKSGANQLHGSWFWDYYNQDMGARLDYQPDANPFNRKRTGGSAGWRFPKTKDKLFWYANWEKTWQQTQNITTYPEFPQLNKVQGFPFNVQYVLGKLDWNVSSNVHMFYKFQHNDDLTTGGTAISPFQNIDWTNTQTVGVDITGARSTNTIRFGFNKFHNRINSQELDTKFLREGGTALQLNVGPISWGPNGLAPQATFQSNYQLSYDGSLVVNTHTVRYGFSYTRIGLGGFANFAGPLTVNGTYDAETIASLKAQGVDVKDPTNFPLDTFSMGPANGFFTLAAGHNLPHGGHMNNRTAYFAGDSWKIRRNFTLNLGIRYEYDTGYFRNDSRVKAEPLLELLGKGYSKNPKQPTNMWSPSVGFAWDLTGKGRTAIRGGFYRAYDMNIFNIAMFDEFYMLPAGIGPDAYDISGVFTPDGNPINVDGHHPNGDYTDLQGQPIKTALPMIVALNSALQQAYANYKFDPAKGDSLLKISRQTAYGGLVPGEQLGAPHSFQFNIGVQHELKPGTVFSADFLYNHGIGMPFQMADKNMRHDVAGFNAAAARAKVNGILKGQTVDQYIAANPKATIATFGLGGDAIFQPVSSAFNYVRMIQGGFTKYKALQLSLRGDFKEKWGIRGSRYQISYSRALNESSLGQTRAEWLGNVFDNHNYNNPTAFGPTGLDYRHMLHAFFSFQVPGGVQFDSLWNFRTAAPQNLFVPNLGGSISSSNGIFGTDLNGDGGLGTGAPRNDVLPGASVGQFGRAIGSIGELNRVLQQFNQNYAGKLTPQGQALVTAGIFTASQMQQLGALIKTIPLVPSDIPNPWHNVFRTDLRISRPIKIREGWVVRPFADIINLFNHNPVGLYPATSTASTLLANRFNALNFDYAKAPPGQQASDLAASRHRLNQNVDGNRLVQIGIRFEF